MPGQSKETAAQAAAPQETTGDEAAQLRVDEIVLAAARLDTAERTVFFDQLKSERPELLAEARRLLAAAATLSEDFLESPAAELPRPSGPPPPSTERYRVGEALGTGGMATVYRAHDLQLHRDVALKVLHPGDADAARRCLAEARAQARVHHEHVVDVYETGEIDGRPFIALRYIRGEDLERVAADLSVDAKVGLMVQVADGLAAAHRKGLVHRDVKPSNILVEERENGALHAWVSDFGIAAQGGSARESLEGTAAYLAPEQLTPGGAALDRRVDVYALGVTLYRLFTGRLPFDASLLPDLFHEIRSATAPSPRTIAPSLPADLEAVILRCLEKDPSRRYASAAAVAEDLRRYLRGELVEAYAAGLGYRVAKFTLRHRRLLAAAVVAAVILAAALVYAAVSGLVAKRANATASLRQGQAEGLIDFMLSDLRARLDELGRLDILDSVGDEAMAYFAAVPEAELSELELGRRATALYQVGSLRLRRGSVDGALDAFRTSLAAAKALYEQEPTSGERLFDLGQSHFWVGYAWREKAELEKAQRHFESYLDVSRRLIERDPTSAEWQLELAYAESNLGTLEADRHRPAKALEHHLRSLGIRRRLASLSPEDPHVARRLASAHNAVGTVFDALGRPAEAEQHFEAQLELIRRLRDEHPENAQLRHALGLAHNYLGGLGLRFGRWREGLEHFDAAVRIYRALAESDPSDAETRFRLAINRAGRGRARLAVGESGGREDLLAYHGAVAELALAPSAPDAWSLELAHSHLQLALALPVGAERRAHLDSALELHRQRIVADPGDQDTSLGLAQALLLQADRASSPSSALGLRQQALDLLRPFAEEDAWYRGQALWVQAMLELGREGEAAPMLERLRAIGFCAPRFVELCAPGTGPPSG